MKYKKDINEFNRDGWKVIPFISLDDARRVDEIKAEDIIAEYAKKETLMYSCQKCQ